MLNDKSGNNKTGFDCFDLEPLVLHSFIVPSFEEDENTYDVFQGLPRNKYQDRLHQISPAGAYLVARDIDNNAVKAIFAIGNSLPSNNDKDMGSEEVRGVLHSISPTTQQTTLESLTPETNTMPLPNLPKILEYVVAYLCTISPDHRNSIGTIVDLPEHNVRVSGQDYFYAFLQAFQRFILTAQAQLQQLMNNFLQLSPPTKHQQKGGANAVLDQHTANFFSTRDILCQTMVNISKVLRDLITGRTSMSDFLEKTHALDCPQPVPSSEHYFAPISAAAVDGDVHQNNWLFQDFLTSIKDLLLTNTTRDASVITMLCANKHNVPDDVTAKACDTNTNTNNNNDDKQQVDQSKKTKRKQHAHNWSRKKRSQNTTTTAMLESNVSVVNEEQVCCDNGTNTISINTRVPFSIPSTKFLNTERTTHSTMPILLEVSIPKDALSVRVMGCYKAKNSQPPTEHFLSLPTCAGIYGGKIGNVSCLSSVTNVDPLDYKRQGNNTTALKKAFTMVPNTNAGTIPNVPLTSNDCQTEPEVASIRAITMNFCSSNPDYFTSNTPQHKKHLRFFWNTPEDFKVNYVTFICIYKIAI